VGVGVLGIDIHFTDVWCDVMDLLIGLREIDGVDPHEREALASMADERAARSSLFVRRWVDIM